MGKRGPKPNPSVAFVPHMKPFLTEIKGILKELHTALTMYEIELREQGNTEEQIQRRIAIDYMNLKREIKQEDEQRML